MKFRFLALALTILISQNLFASVEIYDFKNAKYETLESLSSKLSGQSHYVLGEYHYDKKIQQAQADFIAQMVKTHHSENSFDVHWEFLNYEDNKAIQDKFEEFTFGLITVEEFLAEFGQKKGDSYAPILEITKELQGNFYGVNANRSVKQQIIKDGLGSLDPALIPPNMAMGSDFYLERFRAAMGGHVNEEQLKAYYVAQCYTDSVMSYYIDQFSTNLLSFLIVGSFHSDYALGTVAALRRMGRQNTVNLKFVDKSSLSQDELALLLKPNPKFGTIAEYLVLID